MFTAWRVSHAERREEWEAAGEDDDEEDDTHQLSRRRVFRQSSVVTWGDWSREWSSHRSDEAHVTTPGVPIIGLGRAVPV